MLLVEKEWSWERVPLIECCRTLEELQPLFVSELSLRLYGTQVCSDSVLVFYFFLREGGKGAKYWEKLD